MFVLSSLSGLCADGLESYVRRLFLSLFFISGLVTCLAVSVKADSPGMVWVYINDPGVSGHESFTGYMSKHETTNAQYCEFLNAALASGDIYVSFNRVYGANGSNSGTDFAGEYMDLTNYPASSDSQIIYSSGVFSVRSRDGYYMGNHPVVRVSWYGATAFCNYYGYRLPTEWEWQAVADYDGSYTYGCGTTIDPAKANYYFGDGIYVNPLNLSSYPYTSPVNHYLSYGYGINDMAGNVFEWTSTRSGDVRVFRGGGWSSTDCTVLSRRVINRPYYAYYYVGFRVVRDLAGEPVITGFSQVEPLSWTSANRIDVSANLHHPEIKVDSYVLSTLDTGIQVGYTKHEFVEDVNSVSWDAGTTYVADQVAKNNLYAIADPVTSLVPLHSVTTTSHAQGSFRVEATGPLDRTTVAVDITIPSSVEGYGSTVVDRPDALLRAAYQTALVALHRYDLAAFELAKDAISMNIESKTGISVILPPYNPMDPIAWFDALFMHTACEALDRAYESEFQAKTQVRFQCPLAQFPETGEPLSELSQDYGYTKPTQDFFARFEKSGMLKLNRTIEVPTNTDVAYTIDIKAIAASWGIAQALAHTQGYTVRFTELSTQQTITQSTVILNAPKPEIWPDPELDFQFDMIGDIHATHSLEDNQGQPVIIPTDGNEFVVMSEHSSCLYLVSVPLSLNATDISVDLDVLLSDSLDSVGQKKLLISAVDSENNAIQLVDKDLAEYTYTAFGPAEGFTQHTGFFNVSSDVSAMAGKNVTLMFLLMGKSDDPNRAGLIIDNIRGFAAPVPKASNGDLNDSGKVDFGDYAVFARHWLDTDCNEPDYCEWADLNFDTSVDLADLEIFSSYWLWKKSEPIQGDFNQSKFVDFTDFAILANRWMNSCVDPHWCDGCDFDESGKVDVDDLGEFVEYWLLGTNP
jgi:hypothetical protein